MAQTRRQSYIPRRESYVPRRQSYVLGKDDPEQEQLDQQHQGLMELQRGHVVYAPLRAGAVSRVVDIGCGTGAMTAELARLFPSARVVGVDLADIQRANKPDNVEYVHGDFNLLMGSDDDDDGVLAPGSCDFAFSRGLALGLRDWRAFAAGVRALLRPGGWAEMHEFDFRYRRGSRVVDDEFEHKRALNELLAADGYELAAGNNVEERLRAAGFVDVEVKARYTVPFGSWMAAAKPETATIGALHAGMMDLPAMRGLLDLLLAPAGYPQKEIDRLKADVDRLGELTGLSVEFVVTVGRKPA